MFTYFLSHLKVINFSIFMRNVQIYLAIAHSRVPELNPTIYGVETSEMLPGKDLSMNDLAEQLNLIYCGTMAIEFMHINVS